MQLSGQGEAARSAREAGPPRREEGCAPDRLELGLEQFFERRSGDRTRVDGVCDLGGGYVPTTVTRLVRCDNRV